MVKTEGTRVDRKTAIECIMNKKHVVFNDIIYYPTAYILRIRNNQWSHELELHDLKANSITSAEMEKVEVWEDVR